MYYRSDHQLFKLSPECTICRTISCLGQTAASVVQAFAVPGKIKTRIRAETCLQTVCLLYNWTNQRLIVVNPCLYYDDIYQSYKDVNWYQGDMHILHAVVWVNYLAVLHRCSCLNLSLSHSCVGNCSFE